MAIFLLFLAGENLRSYLSREQVLGLQIDNEIKNHTQVVQEKTFWESILSQNPSYLPGYLELAKINFSLGDKNSAYSDLMKASEINPNSLDVKNLEKELGI